MNRRRLRILQLIYDHPENPWCGGGGAGRAWAINRVLADRHDITVCCGHFPGAGEKNEPFAVRFMGSASRYAQSRLAFMWHSARMDFSSYDLVVEEFSHYAPVISRFGGRPVVSVLQGRHGMNALRSRGVYGVVSLFSEYVLLPGRRALVLVSEHLRSAVNPAAQTVVIGQGVDLPDPPPPSGSDYVLFLGRLDIWHKGIDTLVAAWSRLSHGERRMPLVIAGGGDMAPVQRMLADAGVTDARLTGKLSHAEALAVISRAAFLVMPSRMEGSPLVLYEALALGKPVIGSAIAPIAALLPDGRAGITVPPDAPGRLAEAMRHLLNNLERLTELSKGAAYTGRDFTWIRRAEEQEDFYYRVIREGDGM